MPLELDKLDRKILTFLQSDARTSADTMGARVGLSASAVQRRVARLRDLGAISAEVAVLNAAALGRSLTFIVDIEVIDERPERMETLRRWIVSQPSVQEAWFVTGDSDCVVVITACDMEEYELLMQTLVSENVNVKRFRTRVALSTLKRGVAIPLGTSDA
jgi:Lrp/AsnC family transcriptional regulator, leucine-responsive regulatory protein